MADAKKKTQNKDQNKKKKENNTANQKDFLPSFNENFSDWFNTVIFEAGIIDYRYNLKGCGVWLGYGFKLRRYILNIIRELLEDTPIPHEEYLFPMLIPENQLQKEEETVKGFEDEVYWVTHGGLEPLEVKLALRPTSETVMYPMVAKWIRSHQDLPLKTYQIVNTFRYEGKNTRPLIRVREITTFKEAHTYHATAEDAKNQIREAVNVYKSFFDQLGVPYIISSRPKWDTFPGAEYTIAFDCIFPGNMHRALQIGTVHNLGQTFGKTFDIKYETQEGNQEFVYQTCYGISERGVAAVIASHGDDAGLKLPPKISPIQVVIVPILFKNKEEAVLQASQELYDLLKKANIRVEFDKRDMSSGRKYFHWELKGVPIRIEIGPKDLEKNQYCVVRRDVLKGDPDKKKKIFVPCEEILSELQNLLPKIQSNMWENAKSLHQKWILRTTDLDEALDFIDQNKGIAEIPFCGDEECAAEIEKRVDGMKFLGTPAEYLDAITDSPKSEHDIYCPNCSKPVSAFWRIGRSY